MHMRRQKESVTRIPKKIRTTMNLDKEKVRRVRRALGTKTDTEAVDRALDVVLANAEIESAIDASFGQLTDFRVL